MWQQETSIHRSFTAHMTPVFIVGESAHLEEGNLRRWRDLEGALMYQKHMFASMIQVAPCR